MIVWEITGFSEGGIAIIAAETPREARSVLVDALHPGDQRDYAAWVRQTLDWTVKPWGGVLIVTVGKP